MNSTQMALSKYKKELPNLVQTCEAMRRDTEDAHDITLGELVLEKYQISQEGFYKDLGINPMRDTIQNLVNLPDFAYRWLIPEIFRNAIRLGLRKNPIYPSLIAGEQSVAQTTITMPAINMSEAMPAKTGVGETITTGSVSFDQKVVKISKLARGIKVPYEVLQYVALNIVGIYMQDFGIKMGMGLDNLALTTLQNGDQVGGGDSAPVIGIGNTTTGLTYRDMLKLWVRLARLGKNPSVMIAGESTAIDILDLFTNTRVWGTQRSTIDFKTPIPQNSSVYIHGAINDNQVLIIDPSQSLIKLNAQPLLVETEKIVSNQTDATYASFTTGFATIYRDARILLDKSKLFSGFGFPSYMDPTAQETANFQD